jgi:ATP-dependent DNA helicase RecG
MPYPLFHPLADHPPPLTLSDSAFHRHFPTEGDLVEFKQGLSGRKIQEAAVAFSNAQGGVVLIGVGPDGRVTGLPEPGEKSRQLHQALHDACNLGRFDVHRLSVDGRSVLVLGIDRRHEGFAQTSDGVVRIRRGASNPALIGPELSRFVASRAFSSFESTATGLDLGTADAALLERLRVAFGWPEHDVAERLREVGLV